MILTTSKKHNRKTIKTKMRLVPRYLEQPRFEKNEDDKFVYSFRYNKRRIKKVPFPVDNLTIYIEFTEKSITEAFAWCGFCNDIDYAQFEDLSKYGMVGFNIELTNKEKSLLLDMVRI